MAGGLHQRQKQKDPSRKINTNCHYCRFGYEGKHISTNKASSISPIRQSCLEYLKVDHCILRFFEQAYEHIEEGLKIGNVLVHCFAGVSRSSTIVISFLMKKLNWSYKEAFDHVRKKRWVINPNPGFVKQLRRYDAKLKSTNNPESPERNVEKEK